MVGCRSCLPFPDLLQPFVSLSTHSFSYLTTATLGACSVEMQPSQFEIQREVENLRDIKRRSSAGGPGALVLDPDLPNQSALSAAQLNYWDPSQTASSSSSSAEESGSSADDHDDGSDGGDPTSLFWVPARLHPEIAPAEFRAFIKEHARTPVDGSSTLDRSFSTSSSGLGRKKSMLNREYKPSVNDGIENEGHVVPLRRNKSSYYNVGPQLSISDLQKLDELAEEASQSDDPSKLRSVLRRSLSLNMSPSVIDQMDMPDLGDEADAPIIVPRPGQILRRSARTKIRKPGQTGEGAHRFQTTRSRRISNSRGSPANTHPDQELSLPDFDPKLPLEPDGPPGPTTRTARPESYSDEAFIYDAYATDDPADIVPVLVSQPPPDERPPSPPSIAEFEPQHPSPVQPHNVPTSPTPTLHHPQPLHHLTPTNEPQHPSRTPSPDASSATLVEAPQRSPEPYQSAPIPSPPPPQDRKERDKGKKGGFFGWGGEKGKKGSKEKEKDSSFLGSLFGGSKKKQEEYTGTGLGSGSGRETAAALLGASKSKSRAPSPTLQAGGPYARYPIHVERAIYRLSHIKLANPRRPLYEQVLISNLMFWYLGVINNKGQTNGTGQNQSQAKEPQQQQHGTGQHTQGGQDTTSNPEKERKEQEEREQAERERIEVEKEREKEREREKESLAQQQQPAQKREQKRGPLTKPAPGPPGQRKAEMPVRGPQYEMQHRVMEQEYGGYDPRNPPQNRQGPMPYNPAPQQLVQPQLQIANNMMYYNPNNPPGPNGPSQRSSSPQLPPGAMPPMNPDQAQWKSQGGPRRSRSPPQISYGQNPMMEKVVAGRTPSRSLSASATQQQMGENPGFQHQPNGKLRKGTSAHAVMNPAQRGEDDSPLAMWQQQQRRK
ncbi:hypothetical protein BDM02DRAFT_270811 [Thelephora ganbajun]|uniref:Uncharacterized protein n=1 Tax=Thelephora ganbajun TaxID=370292 RepID=A0ACB6Z9P1_THEGA|nr:hypothetical protein BDM02DRAFT_270811 [Thelephora ganbajun]